MWPGSEENSSPTQEKPNETKAPDPLTEENSSPFRTEQQHRGSPKKSMAENRQAFRTDHRRTGRTVILLFPASGRVAGPTWTRY